MSKKVLNYTRQRPMLLVTMFTVAFLTLLPSMGRSQSTPAALTLSATSQYPLPVAVGCQVVNSFTPSLTSPADANCEITVNSMNWGPAYVTDWTGTNVVGWCSGPDATTGYFTWYWTAASAGVTNFRAQESAQFNVTDCTQSNYVITVSGSVGFSITNVGAVWAADGPSSLCAGSQALISAMINPAGRSVTWAVSNADAGVSILLKYGTTASDATGLATNILIAATNSLSGSATLVAYDSAGNDGMGCGVATWVVAVHAAPLLGIASTNVMVNNDDDDNDGIPDLNAPLTGPGSYVTNENDLIPIYLSSQGLMATQMVTLSVNPAWWGIGGIRVWAHSTRGPGEPVLDNCNATNLILSTNWQASQMPATLWVEGVGASGSLGDVQLTLGTADSCASSTNLTVFLMQLGADVYHRQSITFDDLSPLYFWVNDVGVSGDIIPEGTDIPGSGNNGTSGHVNGRCDVENFTPVVLNFGNTLQLLSPTNGYEYRLIGSDISIVYTSLGMGSAFNYLTDATGTNGYGSGFNVGAYAADALLVNGYKVLSTGFLSNALNNGNTGLILMEGSAATVQPMKLEVWKNGHKIGSGGQLNLSIASVEAMYRQINLRGGYSGPPAAPSNYPTNICNNNQVIFIHGFAVTANDARGWNAEVFKRLYQTGSRTMFTAVDWQGDDHPWFDPNGHSDYYDNVKNAFMTASNFTAAVHDLPGNGKYVIAHSLGNMVVSSAVIDCSLNLNAYIALNTAVATEAFDGDNGFMDMVNPDASSYPPPWTNYDRALWASDWHNLFPNTDRRHDLTWVSRFGIIGNFYNYYSPGEDVLHNSDGAYHGPISVWWTHEFAWVCQEMSKGDTATGLFSSSSQAGWVFNSVYDYFSNGLRYHMQTNQAAAMLHTNAVQFQTNSFFSHFNSAALYDPDKGSTNAADPAVRAEVLGGGIPALSHATGASLVGAFGNAGNNDMMHKFENGWPTSRPKNAQNEPRWLHSDFKYVAFPFNYKLYQDIVVKINN